MREDSLASSHGRSGSLAAGLHFVVHQRGRFLLRGPHVPICMGSPRCVLRAPKEVKGAANHKPVWPPSENWRSRSSVPLHGHHLPKLGYPSPRTGLVTRPTQPGLFHRLQRAGYRLPLCCPRRFRADTNAGAFRLPPFLQQSSIIDELIVTLTEMSLFLKVRRPLRTLAMRSSRGRLFFCLSARKDAQSGCVSVVCTLRVPLSSSILEPNRSNRTG